MKVVFKMCGIAINFSYDNSVRNIDEYDYVEL